MDGDPVGKVPFIFRQTCLPSPSELATKRTAQLDNEAAARKFKADTGFCVWNHWECILKGTVVDANPMRTANASASASAPRARACSAAAM